MLRFIFFSAIIALTNAVIAIYLSKFTTNIYHLLFFYAFFNLCIGKTEGGRTSTNLSSIIKQPLIIAGLELNKSNNDDGFQDEGK
jgi:hypothetical protein